MRGAGRSGGPERDVDRGSPRPAEGVLQAPELRAQGLGRRPLRAEPPPELAERPVGFLPLLGRQECRSARRGVGWLGSAP